MNEYVSPYDLCKRWGKAVTPKTLANWRSLGRGPAYIKLNGRIVYCMADVLHYETQKRRPGENTGPKPLSHEEETTGALYPPKAVRYLR